MPIGSMPPPMHRLASGMTGTSPFFGSAEGGVGQTAEKPGGEPDIVEGNPDVVRKDAFGGGEAAGGAAGENVGEFGEGPEFAESPKFGDVAEVVAKDVVENGVAVLEALGMDGNQSASGGKSFRWEKLLVHDGGAGEEDGGAFDEFFPGMGDMEGQVGKGGETVGKSGGAVFVFQKPDVGGRLELGGQAFHGGGSRGAQTDESKRGAGKIGGEGFGGEGGDGPRSHGSNPVGFHDGQQIAGGQVEEIDDAFERGNVAGETGDDLDAHAVEAGDATGHGVEEGIRGGFLTDFGR